MEWLRFRELSALRPGLNHTVVGGAVSGLQPGLLLPVCVASDEFPATRVVVAEAEVLAWDAVPAEQFARFHYRSLAKEAAGAALDRQLPDGWGAEVTWLWFVVCGWGESE